jgi:K+-sensing histidine kinase KdpD
MSNRLSIKEFSFFPLLSNIEEIPKDGLLQEFPAFCKKHYDTSCNLFYKDCPEGIFKCPKGFSVYCFIHEKKKYIWSGIKILGYIDKKNITKRESARGYRTFMATEITQLIDKNNLIIQILNGKLNGILGQLRAEIKNDQRLTRNAFHEIRPLNAEIKASIHRLRAYIGTLKEKLSTHDTEFLLTQLTNISQSSELISCRMDQRDILINPTSINQASIVSILVRKEIENLYHIFKTYLKKDRLSLKNEIDVKLLINTYPFFRLIPFVIIENAIKYSPANTDQDITVSFKKNRDCYVLSFTSLGPKINNDEKEKIFLAFYRSKNVQEYDGNGIGLYLVKIIAGSLEMQFSLLQADKISFKFNNQDYYETTFSISLPAILVKNQQ